MSHGGGKLSAQRAREVLANPRTGMRAKARAARRLEKLERNRSRAYREDQPRLTEIREATLELAEVMREVQPAIRPGVLPREFLAKAYKVALALRPYRATDASLAAAVYARGFIKGSRRAGFEEFCSALSLDVSEREAAARVLVAR
jgi:hypothetical protein